MPLLANDVDSSSALIELDLTVHNSENGEIGTHSDTTTRMKFRADLPDDDIPRPNGFAAKPFNSSSLSIGIATVTA